MEEKTKNLLLRRRRKPGYAIKRILAGKGYVTDLFSDGEAGYKGFTKGKYDLCVLDVMMPKKTASRWLRKSVLSTLISLLSSLRPRL